MRGFRIYDHTEKVGVTVGRIRPNPEGAPVMAAARQEFRLLSTEA